MYWVLLLELSVNGAKKAPASKPIITAEIKTLSPQEILIEKVASRLTIERDVMKVSWEVTGQQTDI